MRIIHQLIALLAVAALLTLTVSAAGLGGAMYGDPDADGNYAAGNTDPGGNLFNDARTGATDNNASSGSSTDTNPGTPGQSNPPSARAGARSASPTSGNTGANSSTAPTVDDNTTFVGIVVAAIIAIAVILLIIALMPRKRLE